MKRILSLLLALILLLPMFPFSVHAAETVTEQSEFTITADPGIPDNEDLYSAYATKTLYQDLNETALNSFSAANSGTAAGSRLKGDLKTIYDAVVPVIQQIASGQRESTSISVGKAFNYGSTPYIPDVEATFTGKDLTEADLHRLITALLSDMPYEMYWYDKTLGCATQTFVGKTLVYVTLNFSVASNYADGKYQVDTEKSSAATRAVENARQIVRCFEKTTDYNKLAGYCDAICSLVDYDHAAADKGNFTKNDAPWQLIHVFDGNPKTKSVCEGYAKAYLYLCELTTFSSKKDPVQCYTVSGTVNGGNHMWNIVTINKKNYIVDVANIDEGNPSSLLFLNGVKGSATKGYKFAKLTYKYDKNTLDFWGKDSKSILTLDAKAYKPDRGQNHNHSYGSWKTFLSASPDRFGIKQRVCKSCDYLDVSCSATKAMEAPTIKVTTNSSGYPKISWKSVAGAESYRVYRATSKTGSYSRIKSTTSTSYTDTSAKVGKTYYYKVTAVDSDSGSTKTSSVKSKACILATPTVSISANTAGKPVVKWNSVKSAAKYYVYRATGTDGTFKHVKTTVSATSFTDTTAKVGVTYSYKVKAVYKKTDFNSAYSDVVSQACLLAAPSVSIKLTSGGSPYLSWKKISDAKSYEVFRCEAEDGEYLSLGTVKDTKFTDKTALEGICYFYKVKALYKKSAIHSNFSSVTSITAE